MTTYAYPNFPSKKALKEAVARGDTVRLADQGIDPSWNKDYTNFTGVTCLSGPHYPAPHKWYAEVHLTNGKITKIK